MKQFIANKNNQQEWLLLFFAFIVAGIVLFFAQTVELFCLVLIFMLGLLLVYVFSQNMLKLVRSINYSVPFLVFSGVVFFSILLYFQRYYSILIYVLLFFYLGFKKEYTAKYKDNAKTNFLIRQWTNADILVYHFHKEFKLFGEFQKYNLLLLGSYFFSLYLDANDKIPFCGLLWTTDLFMQANFILFIVFVLNSLLLTGIRWIIIHYCNVKFVFSPVEMEKLIHVIFTGPAALATVAYGFHHQSATHPLGDPLTQAYQLQRFGFIAMNSTQLQMASEYIEHIGSRPPTIEGGFLDISQIQAALEEFDARCNFEKTLSEMYTKEFGELPPRHPNKRLNVEKTKAALAEAEYQRILFLHENNRTHGAVAGIPALQGIPRIMVLPPEPLIEEPTLRELSEAALEEYDKKSARYKAQQSQKK